MYYKNMKIILTEIENILILRFSILSVKTKICHNLNIDYFNHKYNHYFLPFQGII